MTRNPRQWFTLAMAMLAIALLLPACDQTGGQARDGKKAEGENEAPTKLRIISLSPMLTQMILEMGHQRDLVGVDASHAQVFENLNLPTVGDYAKINTETVLSLQPTHVLITAGAEGVPADLSKLAGSNNFKLVTFPYPANVRDVVGILMGQPAALSADSTYISAEQSLARVLRDDHAGLFVANNIMGRLGKIGAITDRVAIPGRKPRVLTVIGVEPRIQASGPKTVLHDLITNYAGAYNAAIPEPKYPTDLKDPKAIAALSADPAEGVGTAPELNREQLLELKPDVIVLVLPGGPPLKEWEFEPRLANIRDLDIPAVKNNRVILISDRAAQVPGTTLPETAAAIAKAVHPSVAAEVDQIMAPPAKPAEPEKKPPTDPTPAKPAGNEAETPAKPAKIETPSASAETKN